MADEYEREHMPGIGEVLFRQKTAIPPWLLGVIVALPLVFGGAVAGTSGGLDALGVFAILGGSAAGSAVMGALMAVFAAGRIAVSEGELHVQLGPAGPRIPIESIRSVRVGDSGHRRNGLGARRLLDGTTIFTFFGDNTRAVRIEHDGGGPLILVCREPDALAAALHEAIARRDRKSATPQVRVADEADGDDVAVESARERSASRGAGR